MTTSQISLPAPRTWAANDLVTVPRLRADVEDAVAFLLQRPMFIGSGGGGNSWGAGSDLGVGMNIEIADAWNMHSAVQGGPPTAQVYAPVPGWYLCRSQIPVNWTSLTAAQFLAGFQANVGGVLGSAVRGPCYTDGTGSAINAQCTDLIQQTVSGPLGGSGDYILPTLFASSGVTIGSTAGNLLNASMRWVCATSGTASLPVPPLTSVPSPITSAWLNADVRDTIRYLTYPPICKAYYVAGTSSIPANNLGTPAVIGLTNVLVDNYGGFTTGAAAKYTAPVSGRYFIYGQWNGATVTGSFTVAAGLSVNGGTTQWGDIPWFSSTTAFTVGASVTRRLRLNAGDTVQLMAAQGTGAALGYSSIAANQTRFIAVWEGI